MKSFQFKKGENGFKTKQENNSKLKITPNSHYIFIIKQTKSVLLKRITFAISPLIN